MHLREQSPFFLLKNEKVKDSEIFANAVNAFFLTVADNLNARQDRRKYELSL
jgi:hypothetical protein